MFPDDIPKHLDPKSALIAEGWEDFKTIWPAGHSRKQTGKAARAKYEAACLGKNAKATGPVAPQALNRAARAYIKSQTDPQYIKGTESWLFNARWEPFLEAETLPKQLSEDQKIIRLHSQYNSTPPTDEEYLRQLGGGQ